LRQIEDWKHLSFPVVGTPEESGEGKVKSEEDGQDGDEMMDND
jgi:hypothetical protein